MAIITLKDVHKSYGSEIIFDSLDLKLYKGEKVGLIGPNGCGKTTIFKLLIAKEQIDTGQLNTAKNLKIGYLPQEPIFDGNKTVLEELHKGLEVILNLQQKLENISHKIAEHNTENLDARLKEYDRISHEFEIAGGYEYEHRLKIILEGVGITANLWDVKISALSGGQLSRLGLARVLLNKSDILLLDEPTNHLDLNGRQWLEKFIDKFDGAAVIISHDRYLLDSVCEKIIEIKNKKAKVWTGNYSQFVENRGINALAQERELEKKTEQVKNTLDFIARNINRKGSKGTARGRKTRLERLLKDNPDYLAKEANTKKTSFSFSELKKQSQIALRCQSLSKRFDNLTLFENLNFELYAGQRLGIIGPNGTGKSTLLKVILGKIQPSDGQTYLVKSEKVGYLDQQAAQLDNNATVLEEALKSNPTASKERLRTILGAFLFSGEDVFKKIADLSGGQQNRLALCKLVITNPEVLILDEPTNHLDIDTREMLEDALDEYQGAVLVVSHDRYFLDRIADRVLVIGADALGNRKFGTFEFIDGNYTEYIKLLEQRKNETEKNNLAPPKPKQTGKDKNSNAVPAELKKFNAYSIEKVEQQINALENELAQIEKKFGCEEFYKDSVKFAQLQIDYNNKKAEIDLLYKAYEYKLL